MPCNHVDTTSHNMMLVMVNHLPHYEMQRRIINCIIAEPPNLQKIFNSYCF